MAEQVQTHHARALQERRAADGKRELLLPSEGRTPDLARGSIYFIGTATVLLRYAGFTLLTDPNFLHRGDHVHLGYGLISKRQTDPAMEIEGLPPLDLVVLSHLHGDHFDRVAESKLDKSVPIITTQHAVSYLQGKGFRAALALNTWETLTVFKEAARLRITSMPGRHGPALISKLLPPVMGSMLEFQTETQQTSLRLYISGDTLIYEDLKEIPRRYPDIDLALLHLGGTRILGILVTMDAQQGIEAIRLIQPRKAIPIHYNDYTLFKSPLDDFKRAVIEAGLQDRVHYLSHGDTYNLEIPASRWES